MLVCCGTCNLSISYQSFGFKVLCILILLNYPCLRNWSFCPGGGRNAIYVPYGDMPPIRVYFLAFESKAGCLFSSLTLKQGAKFVLSHRARVHNHSTVWHPPASFDLFVFFLQGKLLRVTVIDCRHGQHGTLFW